MHFLLTMILSVYSIFCAVFGLSWATPYEPADTPESELPSYVEVGDVRVQLLSDRLVRLEQKGERGFENRPSFTVQKRTGWENVEFTQKSENGYTVISAAAYSVYVPDGAASCENCYITDGNGEVIWHFETDTNSNVYLPSPSDELECWYFTDTPRVIPSEDGYSVSALWHNLNGWDRTNYAQDIFVFMPDGSYESFMSDFVELTGRSELISLNLLGYWDSRYYEYSEETALQQIDDYTSKGYPLDVLVIDTDWRKAGSGTGYNINRKLFPNMKKFLKKVHEQGVAVVFNDHPEPTFGTDNLLDKTEIVSRNFNLKKLLDKGLDYWWYDRNWWTSLKPVDEELSIYTTGMYAYNHITDDYYRSIAGKGEYSRRPLIMANVDGIDNGTQNYASELAAHRYTLQWTGDIGASDESLAGEIFNTVYGSSVMGLPYLSSDLGGHTSEVTKDMYIRWIQYGALSPIMRVHCTKPYSRMPWLYGEQAEAVTHTYADMRYRLLPLYYALAHENYETGLPLVRRVDIEFPQYAEADRNDEYLLSDNILVAPLNESYPESEDYSFTCDGKKGLKGEYYANTNFEGTPEVVRYDEKVYFDWEKGAPAGLSVSDYFTVRWTGKLKVGDKPVYFTAYSDDGIRIYLDGEKIIDGWDTFNTYFISEFIQANTEHDIVIEYSDGNEYAHIFVKAYSEGEVSRDVFLPDGRWMDVWTGETYVGPATVTVSHSLDTSPIFVRMGSVITLADNMKNTSEKDWSHLTLDVYPSVDFDGETVLYEDDTETVAYKDGHYRTTAITLRGDKTQTLTVNPAEGKFEGDRAFSEREYTVRVHGRDDWGTLLSASLDGVKVDFEVIAKDESAEPLAIIGGARDNTVYEITFKADISEKSELILDFEYAVEDGVNESYNRDEAEITLAVNKLEKDTASFTIPENSEDWILYGLNRDYDTENKNTDSRSLEPMQVRGKTDIFDDNYTVSWTDGANTEKGSTTNGIVGYHEMQTTLDCDGKTEYRFYIGGYKSVASFTVRDRSGNVQTVSFGNMDSNYYREVVITADGDSDLEVTYSLLCGQNITAAACVKN